MKRPFERKLSRLGPAGAEEDSGAELEAAARSRSSPGRPLSYRPAGSILLSNLDLGALPLLSRLEGSAEKSWQAVSWSAASDTDLAATKAVRLAVVDWRIIERVP